jgi:DNA-binding PadR family transcriptional regulator
VPDKPWKPSRRERRVLLALLSGASSLSGYPLGRVAQVTSGRVYITLAKLERLGWVDSEWQAGPHVGERRRFYHLTANGRRRVMDLLGLEDGNA